MRDIIDIERLHDIQTALDLAEQYGLRLGFPLIHRESLKAALQAVFLKVISERGTCTFFDLSDATLSRLAIEIRTAPGYPGTATDFDGVRGLVDQVSLIWGLESFQVNLLVNGFAPAPLAPLLEVPVLKVPALEVPVLEVPAPAPPAAAVRPAPGSRDSKTVIRDFEKRYLNAFV